MLRKIIIFACCSCFDCCPIFLIVTLLILWRIQKKNAKKQKLDWKGNIYTSWKKSQKEFVFFTAKKKKENKNKNCLQVRVIYFALRGQRQTTTLTTATTTTIRATATTTLKYHY